MIYRVAVGIFLLLMVLFLLVFARRKRSSGPELQFGNEADTLNRQGRPPSQPGVIGERESRDELICRETKPQPDTAAEEELVLAFDAEAVTWEEEFLLAEEVQHRRAEELEGRQGGPEGVEPGFVAARPAEEETGQRKGEHIAPALAGLQEQPGAGPEAPAGDLEERLDWYFGREEKAAAGREEPPAADNFPESEKEAMARGDDQDRIGEER
jgi:hypothetical protein